MSAYFYNVFLKCMSNIVVVFFLFKKNHLICIWRKFILLNIIQNMLLASLVDAYETRYMTNIFLCTPCCLEILENLGCCLWKT